METRTTKDVKRSLLRRAIQEGRGPEMILLILWRNAYNKHLAEKDKEDFLRFEEENFGQPRGVRMLNKVAELEGSTSRYTHADAARIHREGSSSIN